MTSCSLPVSAHTTQASFLSRILSSCSLLGNRIRLGLSFKMRDRQWVVEKRILGKGFYHQPNPLDSHFPGNSAPPAADRGFTKMCPYYQWRAVSKRSLAQALKRDCLICLIHFHISRWVLKVSSEKVQYSLTWHLTNSQRNDKEVEWHNMIHKRKKPKIIQTQQAA